MSITGGRGLSPEGSGSNSFPVPGEQGVTRISPDTLPSRTSLTSSNPFDNSPVNQANNQRRKLTPTNSTQFPNPQEPGRNKTPRIEQPQLGYEFFNEHTEQSSQEVTPLASAGGDLGVNPQQLKILTPEHAEYQRYSELIGGYLEKVASWQRIFDADVSQRKFQGSMRWFSVFRSDNAYSIVFPSSEDRYDPSDKVLEIMNRTYFSDHTENGNDMLGEEFLIRPGEAWKHLLLDPGDGVPLKEVRIDIGSQPYPYNDTPFTGPPPRQFGDFNKISQMQHIQIYTVAEVKHQNAKSDIFGHLRAARYNSVEDTLQVRHKDDVHYEGMTDEMITKLLDTIDELIPKNSNPTIQPETRAADMRRNVDW